MRITGRTEDRLLLKVMTDNIYSESHLGITTKRAEELNWKLAEKRNRSGRVSISVYKHPWLLPTFVVYPILTGLLLRERCDGG